MRFLSPALGLGALLLLSGCADSKWSIFRHPQDSPQLTAGQPPPTAAQLVAYVNANAVQIKSLRCSDVDLDCQQGYQQFHIRGKLACQKPRNFRMQAEALAKTEADIGSNDQEFWYWIAKGDPYLIHCSYQDLANGVRIPFPFQPEWVMEALGMSEYDPAQSYEVSDHGKTYWLVQNTKNAQGQRVRKVTVFEKQPSRVQVPEHILMDATGNQEICKAKIVEAETVARGAGGTGIVLPRKIIFTYPAERLTLKMTLWHRADDLALNPSFDPAVAQKLFTRPALSGVANYDLAHGPEGTSQVRPAGGALQQR